MFTIQILLLFLLITYFLTPWSRVLLVKLIGSQLVKEFPVFYGTRRFSAAFTSARHMSLSWARSIQSMSPHLSSWRSSLMLSFQLRKPTSSKWSISLRFPHQNLTYTYLLSHTCCMPRPSHSSRFYYPSNIEWGVQVIEFLIVQFFSSPLLSHPP